jgi:hypothetical protein
MDIVFNSYKMKYLALDELIGMQIKRNNIKTCNLFFNLDYINYRFRNVQSNARFQACGAAAFKQYASNVLNLVAHYKKWFVRHGLNTRCFIYYTNATGGFTSALIHRTYRQDFIVSQSLNNPDCYYVNLTINGGINILSKICDYIDEVYIINSKGEEPSVVPYLIAQKLPADWNYILTKDRLELQYVTYDKFSIIYPSKITGDRVINASNLWQTIGDKEHKSTPHLTEFDPRLFIPAMAIAGDMERSVRKIRSIGWVTILETLEEIWCTNQDHSIITMLDELEKVLQTKNKATTEKYIKTYNNNILTFSMKSRYDVMSEVNKTMLLSQIKDIPDAETINEISNNPMILGNYPINVEALFAKAYVNWDKK